jgi:hypothetical protein
MHGGQLCMFAMQNKRTKNSLYKKKITCKSIIKKWESKFSVRK